MVYTQYLYSRLILLPKYTHSEICTPSISSSLWSHFIKATIGTRAAYNNPVVPHYDDNALAALGAVMTAVRHPAARIKNA